MVTNSTTPIANGEARFVPVDSDGEITLSDLTRLVNLVLGR